MPRGSMTAIAVGPGEPPFVNRRRATVAAAKGDDTWGKREDMPL